MLYWQAFYQYVYIMHTTSGGWEAEREVLFLDTDIVEPLVTTTWMQYDDKVTELTSMYRNSKCIQKQ